MQINEIIDKKVYIQLEKNADFSRWDIKAECILIVVSGVQENLGIWVRHPNYKVIFKIDKSGNSIPADKRKQEEIEADLFIPWRYIKGIFHIRDDRLKREKNPERLVGFNVYKKDKEI